LRYLVTKGRIDRLGAGTARHPYKYCIKPLLDAQN
jgi:hypothetical protein